MLLPEPPAAIHWACSSCADDGLISNWSDSPYDLRRRALAVAGPVNQIATTDEVASALRNLPFMDIDYAQNRHSRGVVGKDILAHRITFTPDAVYPASDGMPCGPIGLINCDPLAS